MNSTNPTNPLPRIAVLGLGAMGQRMARRLLDAGYDVSVYNRTASATRPLVAWGAQAAGTPSEATLGRQFVISMLRDDAASEQVWLDEQHGALQALDSETIAIESSTLSLSATARLHAAFAERGRRLLDAPVAGSRPQAEAGQLIHLVGGDAQVLAAARPVLVELGQAVHHVGGPTTGMKMKLAVNALLAIQAAGLAEVLALLERPEPSGTALDARHAMDILGEIPVISPAARAAGRAMVDGAFAPQFPLELVEKDMQCVLAAASEKSEVLLAAHSATRRALREGLGAENITALVRLSRDTSE